MARPRGSKNLNYEHVTAYPVSCPNCGSTERTAFGNKAYERPHAVTFDGRTFTHIVKRPCKCGRCGQALMVTAYENRNQQLPEAKTDADTSTTAPKTPQTRRHGKRSKRNTSASKRRKADDR